MSLEVKLAGMTVSIGFPCGAHIPWQTSYALATTMYLCAQEGVQSSLEVVAGSPDVTAARSAVVDQFLNGSSSRLFWIDSDIVWEPNDFFRLLAFSDKMDVVCGAYPMKTVKRQFCVKHPDLKNFEINDFGCIKIEGTGLGFAVMTREVIERVAATKARAKDMNHVETADVFRRDVVDGYKRGEDQAFFADIREQGYDVWLDPTIQLGHVGSHVYRGDAVAALNLAHVYRPTS